MQIPDGRECKYYYRDFHRGRNVQECRIPKSERSADWQPSDCSNCPVPDILRANASPDMRLTLTIKPPMFGFGRKRKMLVDAWCEKHDIPIKDPFVGCPRCAEERPGLQLFADALRDEPPEDE